MGRDSIFIAVIGDGHCGGDLARLAEEVGRLLAEEGAILVCGGLGGVMEASCRGAKAAGGLTVGILPGQRRNEANDFVDIPLPTGLGVARNALVVGAADAAIAVGGGYGTLSEIGFALRLGVPVVGLNTWSLRRKDGETDHLRIAHSPQEAVDLALKLAVKGKEKARLPYDF